MSEKTQAKSTILLPEEFILSTLSELKATIDGFTEVKPSLLFDASAVERVDGAALQFLWQCHSYCAVKGLPFLLKNPSETICDAIAVVGMKKLLLDN